MRRKQVRVRNLVQSLQLVENRVLFRPPPFSASDGLGQPGSLCFGEVVRKLLERLNEAPELGKMGKPRAGPLDALR